MLRRIRRFAVIACAATISVLALVQGGQAYDQICINGQCGVMTPVGGSPYQEAQSSYQLQDYPQASQYSSEENDSGVQWITPPDGQTQQVTPPQPVSYPTQSQPPVQPPVQPQSFDNQAYVNKVADAFGVDNPPQVVSDCGDGGYRGQARLDQNTVAICDRNIKSDAERRYVIAHEIAHYQDYRRGTMNPFNREEVEQYADTSAVDYLAGNRDWAPVEHQANAGYSDPAYEYGAEYARVKLQNRVGY